MGDGRGGSYCEAGRHSSSSHETAGVSADSDRQATERAELANEGRGGQSVADGRTTLPSQRVGDMNVSDGSKAPRTHEGWEAAYLFKADKGEESKQEAHAVGRKSRLSEHVDDWPLPGWAGITCPRFLLNPDEVIRRLMPVLDTAPYSPGWPQGGDNCRGDAKAGFSSHTRSLCWYLVGCLAPLAAENPGLQQLLLRAVASVEPPGRKHGCMQEPGEVR